MHGPSNAELVRQTVEQIAQDLDAARKVWTDATVERFPDRTCTARTRMRVLQRPVRRSRTSRRGDHDRRLRRGRVVQWRMTGRHTGPGAGCRGTGRELAVDAWITSSYVTGWSVEFVIFDQSSSPSGRVVAADGSMATGR